MTEVTWAAVVGVLLLLSQILNIYNSSKAAQKNAGEPIRSLEKKVADLESHLMKTDFTISSLKDDVDHAHQKIRENEKNYIETSKAQNKALLAILLWIKDPEHGDTKQIDDAIKGISV